MVHVSVYPLYLDSVCLSIVLRRVLWPVYRVHNPWFSRLECIITPLLFSKMIRLITSRERQLLHRTRADSRLTFPRTFTEPTFHCPSSAPVSYLTSLASLSTSSPWDDTLITRIAPSPLRLQSPMSANKYSNLPDIVRVPFCPSRRLYKLCRHRHCRTHLGKMSTKPRTLFNPFKTT